MTEAQNLKSATEPKRLSIKANMAWNASGSIVYLAAQWLITVLVVRLSSGYDAAGLLALGMAVANVFNPIGYYKIRAFQVSDLESEFDFGQYLGFRIVTIAISVVVMVVYGGLTCPDYSWAPVFLYGIYSLGPVFVDVIHGEDQRRSRMDGIGVSLVIRGIVSLIAFCAGMILFNSLDISLALMIAGTFFCIAIYDVGFLKRALHVPFRPVFELCVIRSLLVKCLPLVVAFFFCSATPVIPRQLLEEMMGEAALGIYASVASPILIVQMCAQYLYAPLLSRFAELYHARDSKGFLGLLLKVSLGILLLTVVLSVFFAIFGEFVMVLLYGESIAGYTYLIGPLVVCTALVAYLWCLGDVLIVMRKNRDNLIGNVIMFALSVGSMYFFISGLGMNGVSFTLIFAYVLGFVYFAVRIITLCISMDNGVKKDKCQDSAS